MGPTIAGTALPRVFVISDVHVGAGELDDFVPALEEKLIRFIDTLARLPQTVELVINGDFFDFATAAPWNDPQLESTTDYGLPLCFTEDQSCRKLEQIIASHAPVFDALARLLAAGPDNRITMLPGNHDADLFWPRVRKGIEDRLVQGTDGTAMAERFAFVLERKLVIERGGERYWIEHGHQLDPPNSFFPDGSERWSAAEPPLFRDRMQHWRLYECPGTLGLVRYINHWRQTYRSISYIKPYSKVLRALIQHRAFKQPGRPLMVLRHLVAFLGWNVDLQTSLSGDGDISKACDQAVQALMDSLTSEEEVELTAQLTGMGLQIVGPLRNYVKTPLRCRALIDQVAREVSGNTERPVLAVSETTLGFMVRGFIKDAETKALVEMARRLLDAKWADYVLTGHTHSPLQELHRLFTNGGCWIPNQAVDARNRASDIIFEHGPVEYKLSYIEIRQPGPPRLRKFGRGTICV